MLRGGVFRGSNGDSVLFVAGVCAGNRTRRGVRRVETKMVTSVGPDLARYSGPPGQDPKEMFDVYSPPRPDHNGFISREERGKPLMTKRRQMVHRDGDWHRSVHAWLVHPGTKSMVIQKRSPWKDTNPDKWDVSAAGHITHGQLSEETARKELEEELGFVPDGLALTYLFTSVSEHEHEDTKCNLYQDVYIMEVKQHPDEIEFCSLGQCEVSAVKFVPIKAIKEAMEQGDETFVQRSQTYRTRLFQYLEERYDIQ